MSAMGLRLPIRMTIARLTNGDLLLHSPTPFSADLAVAVDTLGRVRHLVAPNVAHWKFLADWQRAYPDATTWSAPSLRLAGLSARLAPAPEVHLAETLSRILR